MERSGFFDANLVSGTYDRKYVSQDFADYFASFVGNGVFGSQLDELMVVQSDPNAMSVTLKPGRAWINGRWYENDKDMVLTIGTANGTYARIDNVVIHWSKNDREIRAEVVEGIPGASPSAPEIRRTDDEFDLKLAEVKITAGALTITQANITDFRDNAEACGFVKGLIDQVTASDYIQMALASQKAAFDAWLENLEYQLSGDVAGNLQNQINQINEELPNVAKADEVTLTKSEENVFSLKDKGVDFSKFSQNAIDGITSSLSVVFDYTYENFYKGQSTTYPANEHPLTFESIERIEDYSLIMIVSFGDMQQRLFDMFIDVKKKKAHSKKIGQYEGFDEGIRNIDVTINGNTLTLESSYTLPNYIIAIFFK